MALSIYAREVVDFIERRDTNYPSRFDHNITMEMAWDRFISGHTGWFGQFLKELEANKRFDIMVRWERSQLVRLINHGYDIDTIVRLAVEA